LNTFVVEYQGSGIPENLSEMLKGILDCIVLEIISRGVTLSVKSGEIFGHIVYGKDVIVAERKNYRKRKGRR
jgi:hypothetical protein